MRFKPWMWAGIILAIIFACACICLTAGYSSYEYIIRKFSNVPTATLFSSQQPSKTPSKTAAPAAVFTPTIEQLKPTATTVQKLFDETLLTFRSTLVPINDPLDIALRLEGKQNLSRSLDFPPQVLPLGTSQVFWATNTDSNENFQVTAHLSYVSEHVYFWIEENLHYRESHLEKLVEAFEKDIYPTNREFFGSEWTPGVDADPHLYILYVSGLGQNTAGYFSTADEFLPAVRPFSNGHEMFFLNADSIRLNDEYTYGILAHEFQHMIHWYTDRNEETWMNEGFSNLAMLLNGYDVGGSDRIFVSDPDIQLTDWPTEPEKRSSHYGGAFLFLTYFLDRFGEQATKALVAHPENGMESIDLVLDELGAIDALNGNKIRAEDVFTDWIITNLLGDAQVLDGRYAYHIYPEAPKVRATERYKECPFSTQKRDVSQFGADYIEILCKGDYLLKFSGSTEANVLPVEPHSGAYYFYSNTGDESDITLTKKFDFREQDGPLTLSYWTWYDIEEDYDYVYLTASEDGENWQILITPSGTADNPSGNSYGWAYNGKSGGDGRWIQENVDISQFAGKIVYLRFEYITDAAVNGEGFVLDDLSIPETGYFTDFEQDNGGWEASGFVRIQNKLPQRFHLVLVSFGNQITIEFIPLSPENQATISLSTLKDAQDITLIVAGLTPFTRQKAVYQISVEASP